MGISLNLNCFKSSNSDSDFQIDPFTEIGERQIINNEKFIINFKINENEKNKENANSSIELEVIHKHSIDSTMPKSRQYIDEGNIKPFIYNTEIQTQGQGKGARKWAGSILGNIYTSSCIPIKKIKNELNSNDIIVKITAISIIQQLRKYSKDQFFLKYPNDIICVDRKKLGGILVEFYKDFCIIGFGINIVDKPEQSEIRKGGLLPCFVNEHLPETNNRPKALDLSIEITKQIIYNLKKTKVEIDNLFDKYVQKEE